MLTLPSRTEQAALVASLAPQRLRAFRRVTGGDDRRAIAATDTLGHQNPGRVVAQLTFGAWTGLLDRGGPLSRGPDATLADYDATVWGPALRHAFVGAPERAQVHALAQSLNWARNRINHCEPVVFGFPQQGQGTHGRQQRKSPGRVVGDARALLALLDADVAAWMSRWHAVDRLVRDPSAQAALPRTDPRVQLLEQLTVTRAGRHHPPR